MRTTRNVRSILSRVRKVAKDRFPRVVQDVTERLRGASPTGEAAREPTDLRSQEALARLHAKSESGLKPEDRLVVIYATPSESEAVHHIKEALEGIDATIREMDLTREPQTHKQLAKLSNVMVPPYVFINGRYWGGPYELVALREAGDLEHVVAHRFERLSESARRMGGVRETFSDDISVENLLSRWRLGHILSVDDLDSWFEVDRDGSERFFYEGRVHDPAQMRTIAEHIVEGVARGEVEARWMLDPEVRLP